VEGEFLRKQLILPDYSETFTSKGKYPVLFNGEYIITKKLGTKLIPNIFNFVNKITEEYRPSEEEVKAVLRLNQYSKHQPLATAEEKDKKDKDAKAKRREEKKREWHAKIQNAIDDRRTRRIRTKTRRIRTNT
jgi:hypothetical protein